MVEDHPRERRREHQDHQPRQAGLPCVEDAGLEIGLVRGEHSGHLLEVLRRLLLDDVHCVVDGDDADQPLLHVDDGQGEEAVLVQRLRHVLLIVHRLGPDDVRIHDLLDQVVLLREEQVTHRQHAEQVARRVGDVQDVDRLHVAADTADTLEGVLDGHVLFQGEKLHVHDGTGRVLGVFENFVDGFAHLGRGPVEDADHDACGHLLDDIDGVVEVQLVEHLLQLGVGKAVDEHLLAVTLQLDEHLGRRLLREQPVQQRHKLFTGFFQQQRDVRRLHGQKQLTQLGILFTSGQLLDFFQILVHFLLIVKHIPGSSSLRK